MPLLNYTSKTPAHQSIAEISQLLAKAGARQVMHAYDDSGNIIALSFSLELDGQRIGFRLPSDWRPVQLLLEQQLRNNPNARPWMRAEDHARDVARRIIKDWVEAQLAIIETHMVTTTAREHEVLRWYAHGLKTSEIANRVQVISISCQLLYLMLRPILRHSRPVICSCSLPVQSS